jgi:peptide/nickel transport system substrate-binding protein
MTAGNRSAAGFVVRGLGWKAAMLGVGFCLVLSACGSGSGDGGGSASTASDFTVAIKGEPPTLELMRQDDENLYKTIGPNVVETLAVHSLDGSEVKPLLATSWKAIDPKTWSIELRDGVTFSNGDPMTAEDVAASINYAVKDNGAYAINFLSTVDSAEAASDSEVTIHLNADDAIFEERLPFIYVMPKDVVANSDTNKLVGTGPYEFDKWQRGTELTLKKNPDYWGDPKPAYDTVNFIFREEPTVRASEVQSGNADLAFELSPTSDGQVPQLVTAPGLNVSGYLLNQAGQRQGGSIMEDPKVREAVAHAIDRKSIVEKIYGVGATLANCEYVPSTFPGHSDDLTDPAYDPELAKSLVQQAGVEGATVDIAVKTSWPNTQEVSQLIAEELTAIGLKPKLHPLTDDQFLDIYHGNPEGADAPYDMATLWHSNEFFTPVIKTFDAMKSIDAGGGIWTINSPALDQAIAAAVDAKDEETRDAAIQNVWKTGCDEVDYITIGTPANLYGVADGIKFSPRADGYLLINDQVKSDE